MKISIQSTLLPSHAWSAQYDCASNARTSSIQFPAASTSQALFSRLSSPREVAVLDAPSRRKERTTAQAHLQIYSVAAPTNEVVKWWERDLGANLMDVHSIQELSDAITAAKGKLVVVEFFASWCGSCRALYPKLCKLAVQHNNVVFLKVNFEENKPLCKSLNVKVLPYFHFYQGSMEQLDSFSCSVIKLQRLKDAIMKYSPSSQDRHSEELTEEHF